MAIDYLALTYNTLWRPILRWPLANRLMDWNEGEQLLRQYLLGEMMEEQQHQVQDRLMADPDYFKALLMIEGELTDEYIYKILTGDEEERFKNYFLTTPERTEMLRTTQSLKSLAVRKLNGKSAEE
jgi:hypothetical protein